jgi:thiol-disulfide isomerase/thioredoxin
MKIIIVTIVTIFSALTLLLSGCDARATYQDADKPGQSFADPESSLFFPGQPIHEVQQLLGEPNGTVTSGNETILLYGNEILSFVDGKWDNYQPDIRKQIAASTKALAKQAGAMKTLPWAGGIASTGTPCDYSSLVSQGTVTIVDFHAAWCNPCKKIAPILDSLASQQPGITLRRVEIASWESSVVKKYNITSVPKVLVFDKNGCMVGTPTSDTDQVARYIAQAKRKK